jgi:hypothetical protein
MQFPSELIGRENLRLSLGDCPFHFERQRYQYQEKGFGYPISDVWLEIIKNRGSIHVGK